MMQPSLADQPVAPPGPPAVELRGAGRSFETPSTAATPHGVYAAVEELSFSVGRGEFVAVVGPSGCGKSTVLNMVAGLYAPSAGVVLVDGKPVRGITWQAAYMFQGDSLLPWKTVLQNVLLGPTLRGTPRGEAIEQARGWLRRVGLEPFADRYPHQLSGGMRKRVSLVQDLVTDPAILLMDEPFSALDVQTRALMEDELLALWAESGKTVIFVTHDLEEAIALSDRVLLLTAGPAAHLKGEYRIDLPRPRDVSEVRFQPGFQPLFQRIWNDLREEVLKSYEASKREG